MTVDLTSIKHVETVEDEVQLCKSLEEGWKLLSVRVQEWVVSDKGVPFKQSTFVYSIGFERVPRKIDEIIVTGSEG